MNPKLIIIGGFLGAGKTTLMRETALCLTRQGKSVGLITNDQAPNLVDTAILKNSGLGVMEVSGSCFCCDFPGFESAIQSLMDRKADVILAEPVGSCTDLVATVMQPLKQRHPDIDLAPLAVLVSPEHICEAVQKVDTGMHDDAVYILCLQMMEADHLLLNKIDALNEEEITELTGLLQEAFPAKPVSKISALTGTGVGVWLETILGGGEAGTHSMDVDYDRYAAGEAALGWLNASLQLQLLEGETDLLKPALALMESLHQEFRARNAEIGHVKVILESGNKQRTANLTSLNGHISVLDQSPLLGTEAVLILNARVQMPAEDLESIARRVLNDFSGQSMRACISDFRCLTPGRPHPTYRMNN